MAAAAIRAKRFLTDKTSPVHSGDGAPLPLVLGTGSASYHLYRMLSERPATSRFLKENFSGAVHIAPFIGPNLFRRIALTSVEKMRDFFNEHRGHTLDQIPVVQHFIPKEEVEAAFKATNAPRLPTLGESFHLSCRGQKLLRNNDDGGISRQAFIIPKKDMTADPRLGEKLARVVGGTVIPINAGHSPFLEGERPSRQILDVVRSLADGSALIDQSEDQRGVHFGNFLRFKTQAREVFGQRL